MDRQQNGVKVAQNLDFNPVRVQPPMILNSADYQTISEHNINSSGFITIDQHHSSHESRAQRRDLDEQHSYALNLPRIVLQTLTSEDLGDRIPEATCQFSFGASTNESNLNCKSLTHVDYACSADLKYDLSYDSSSKQEVKNKKHQTKPKRSSSSKQRGSQRDEIPVKLAKSQDMPLQSTKRKKSSRKPPPVPQNKNISIIKELVDEESIETAKQAKRKDKQKLSETCGSGSSMSSEFKLPRFNLSSQFTTLAQQTIEEPLQFLSKSPEPEPEQILVKPLTHHLNCFQSAETDYDTQRSRAPSTSHLRDFSSVEETSSLLDLDETEQAKEKFASMFHNTRLAGSVLKTWFDFAHDKSLDRQLYTSKSEQILDVRHNAIKIAVFKALSSNVALIASQRTRLRSLIARKERETKRTAVSVLKEGCVFARAVKQYQGKLIYRAFTCLCRYSCKSKLNRGLRMNWNQKVKEKVLLSWKQFAQQARSEAVQMGRARDLYGCNTLLKCLRHLRWFAAGRKKANYLTRVREYRILQRSFSELNDYCLRKQDKAEQSKLVETFSRCNLARNYLKILSYACAEQNRKRELNFQEIFRARVTKMFHAFRSLLIESKIRRPAKPLLIKYSKIWLEACFAELMSKVWLDFPRMKVSKIGQRPALLPNYMTLSKRTRYRGFFDEVNLHLYKDKLSSCFRYLRSHTSRIRQFKLKIVFKHLRTVFTTFNRECSRQSYARQVITDRKELRSIATKQKVVMVLKAHLVLLKQSRSKQLQVRKKTEMRGKVRFWDRWRTVLERKRMYRSWTEYAEQCHRTKLVSSCMQQWLSQFILASKKRDLQKLSTQLTQTKRCRYFSKWRQVFLWHQVKKEDFQNRQSQRHYSQLSRIIAAMREYTARRAVRRFKRRVAIQQHTYFIGKNCFSLLYSYWQKQRCKRILIAKVAARNRKQKLQSVYKAINDYYRSTIARRNYVMFVYGQIQGQRKAKLMAKWHRVFRKRAACKYLSTMLFPMIKKASFDLIKAKAEFIQGSRPHMVSFKLRQIIAQWRQVFVDANRFSRLRRDHQQMRLHRFFEAMQRQITLRKEVKRKTAVFLQFQVEKRKRRVFLSLRRNVLMLVQQRQDNLQMIKQMKLDVFWALLSNVASQKQLQVRLRKFSQRQEVSSKKRWLLNWRHELCKERRLQRTFNHALQQRKMRLFKAISTYAQKKLLTRLADMSLFQKYKQQKARKALHFLHRFAISQVETRKQNDKATHYFTHQLLRRRLLKLLQSQVTPLTSKKVQLKVRHSKWVKRAMLNVWLNLSEKAIQKVRRNAKVRGLLTMIHLRDCILTWRQFIEWTKACHTKLQQFLQKRSRRLVQAWSAQTRANRERRQKWLQVTSTVKSKVFRRVTSNCFESLRRYRDRCVRIRQCERVVTDAHGQKISRIAYEGLKHFAESKRTLSSKLAQLQKRSRAIYLSLFWFKWQHSQQQAVYARCLDQAAIQKRTQWLQMQTIRQLCGYAILRQNKKQLVNQLQEGYAKRVVLKCFEILKQRLEYRCDIEIRRSFMAQTISKVASDVTMKQAFDAIVSETIGDHRKQTAILHRHFKLQRSTLTRLFDYTSKKAVLSSAYSLVVRAHNEQVTLNAFKKWNLLFLHQCALRQAFDSHQVKKVRGVFMQLRAYCDKRKKLRFADQQRQVVIVVKAFESMKQYREARLISQQKSVTSYQHLSKTLQSKVIKALCIVMSRKHLLELVKARKAKQSMSKAFEAWDRQLQLNMTRSNAFTHCYALFMKRQLQHWHSVTADICQQSQSSKVRSQRLLCKLFKCLKQQTQLNIRLRKYPTKLSLMKKSMTTWRKSFAASKLSRVIPVMSPLRFAFDQLYNFQDHKAFLSMTYRSRQSKQPKPCQFNLWLHQDLVKQSLKTVVSLVTRSWQKEAVCVWKDLVKRVVQEERCVDEVKRKLSEKMVLKLQFAFGKQPEKVSMLRTIFHSWRRVLYTLHKCNRLDTLLTHHQLQARQHTQVKFLQLWLQSYQVKRQKNCVVMYLQQTYVDKITMKVFKALSDNRLEGRIKQKKKADEYLAGLTIVKCRHRLQQWHLLTQYRQSVYSAAQSMDIKRKQTMKKHSIDVLRAYAYEKRRRRYVSSQVTELRQKQTKLNVLRCLSLNAQNAEVQREMDQIAVQHRMSQLAVRVMHSFKINVVQARKENTYSRQFAVFTAWKSLVIEQKLLSQYLQECNYPVVRQP